MFNIRGSLYFENNLLKHQRTDHPWMKSEGIWNCSMLWYTHFCIIQWQLVFWALEHTFTIKSKVACYSMKNYHDEFALFTCFCFPCITESDTWIYQNFMSIRFYISTLYVVGWKAVHNSLRLMPLCYKA